MTPKSLPSGHASCSLLPESKGSQGAAEYRSLPCPLVFQSRNKVCSLLLGHLNTLQPAPLLLHKSWWLSEHMIMSMMSLRLLSQHCCWWSHSKLGWFVQWMSLTITFFPIQSGMAKWLNLEPGRVSLLLIEPLIFHIPYSKGSFSLCPSYFRSAPWAVSKHLTQQSLTATLCLWSYRHMVFVLVLSVLRSWIELLHFSPEGILYLHKDLFCRDILSWMLKIFLPHLV